MSNTTKLVASLSAAAVIFLLAAIAVHLMGGFPKHLDTVLALSAGVSGMVGAIIGFATNLIKPLITN